MITRAALGIAALLASAALASPSLAADRDGSARAAHHHAGFHHRHHLHHHHGLAPGAQRRVLYRNPAYGGGWHHRRAVAWHARHHHRWHAAYRQGYAAPAYAHPVRTVRYTYARPVAGSYLGGGLIGALFNQPACYCR